MSTATSRTCCCGFVHARIGAAIFASCASLVGVGFLVFGVVVTNQLNPLLDDTNKMALYLHCLVYLLLALFSSLGIYGTVVRRRKLMTFYFSSLLAHILFSVASGAWLLSLLFQKSSPDANAGCEGTFSNPFTRGLCERNSTVKGLSASLLVLTWVFQICGLFIVNIYSGELGEEEVARVEKQIYDEI